MFSLRVMSIRLSLASAVESAWGRAAWSWLIMSQRPSLWVQNTFIPGISPSTSSTPYKHFINMWDLWPVLKTFLICPQVNETFSPPDDKCVNYTCQDVNGDPMVKESRKTCPDFNPENCVPVSFSLMVQILIKKIEQFSSHYECNSIFARLHVDHLEMFSCPTAIPNS